MFNVLHSMDSTIAASLICGQPGIRVLYPYISWNAFLRLVTHVTSDTNSCASSKESSKPGSFHTSMKWVGTLDCRLQRVQAEIVRWSGMGVRGFPELVNYPTSTCEEAYWQFNNLHSSGFRLSTRFCVGADPG